jgi:transcriptional regulator
MYVPKQFRPASEQAVQDFLAESTFATLVTCHDGMPVATHLPVELVDEDKGPVFLTHMARANPQWRQLADDHQALLIVEGPHAYVSPEYYDDTEVPTWNYIAAHVYGQLQVIEDADALLTLLKRQIVRNEAPRPCPVLPERYDEAFLRQSQRGAVGLRLRIERVEAAFKLSQNRSLQERDRLSMQFEGSDEVYTRALGAAMRESVAMTLE